MWYILTAVLYATCAIAYDPLTNPYPFIIEDRNRLTANSGPPRIPSPYTEQRVEYDQYMYQPLGGPASQVPRPLYQQTTSNDYNFIQSHPFRGYPVSAYQYPLRQGILNALLTRGNEYPLELDYSSDAGSEPSLSDSDTPMDPKPLLDSTSYSDDLDLVERFAYYLKKATLIDPQTSSSNDDAAHQFNALLSVIVALAQTGRIACSDFDQVYDRVYDQTINTYYIHGLANADKVNAMIEDYIRKGKAHIQKITKLKEEICGTYSFCPRVIVDNRIKSSSVLYTKELETLKALSQIAHKFYSYIAEFNRAAQQGTMLSYLEKNKYRLKDYIMHVINSMDHISDKQIQCL